MKTFDGTRWNQNTNDTVSVKDFGAVGDGVTDDTSAIKSAILSGAGKTVHFPSGRYKILEELTIPNNTQIVGSGSSNTILDWSKKSTYSSGAYNSLIQWEKGTLSNSVSVPVNVLERDTKIDLGAGAGNYSSGDIIRISSDDVSFGESTRAEFQRILGIDGTVIELSSGVLDNYTPGNNIKVEKLTPVTGGFSGVTLVGKGPNPDGYADNAIQLFFTDNFIIDDVQFKEIEHRCIMLNSCIGTKVVNCNFFFNAAPIALQYGVGINGASQMTVVHNCTSYNDRHLVTTNSTTSTSATFTYSRGIARIITVSSCTSTGSWQAPIDTHRSGEYITVVGNTFTTESTGIKIRGKRSMVIGNTMVGKLTSTTGTAIGIRVMMGCEDIQITGNLIKNFGSGVQIDGPDGETKSISVNGNTVVDCGYSVYLGGSADTLTGVSIINNQFRSFTSGTPTPYCIYIVASTVDLTIQGNVIEGGSMGIYISVPSVTQTDMVIKDNRFKSQSSHATFLRNITNGMITGNYSSSAYRFTENTTNVYYGWNFGTLNDLSSGGIKTASWS